MKYGRIAAPSSSASAILRQSVNTDGLFLMDAGNRDWLMAEVVPAGEDHREPMFVRGGDHLRVSNRPSRLHDRGCPGRRDRIEPVAERKERIGCGDTAGKRVGRLHHRD